MIVTDHDDWREMMASYGPYAQPEWASLWRSTPVALVVAGDLAVPLVLDRDRRIAHPPPGDGGAIGPGCLDGIADALAADFDRLVVHTDPLGETMPQPPQRYLHSWLNQPPSVVCDLSKWHEGAMAKGHRRDIAKMRTHGWRWQRLHSPRSWEMFVRIYAENARRNRFEDGYELTIDHVCELMQCGLDARLYGSFDPDGAMAAGIVAIRHGNVVAMHLGATSDAGTDWGAMKLVQAGLLYELQGEGVRWAIDGPGIVEGDGLERYKMRFGSTEARPWRRYEIDLTGAR